MSTDHMRNIDRFQFATVSTLKSLDKAGSHVLKQKCALWSLVKRKQIWLGQEGHIFLPKYFPFLVLVF